MLFAKNALLIAGIALLGPALGVAAVIGVTGLALTGGIYRWEMGKAKAELHAALAAIETSIRAFDIFGSGAAVSIGKTAVGSATVVSESEQMRRLRALDRTQ